MQKDDIYKISHIFCPNCGSVLNGCENKEQITKYRCPKCGCIIKSQKITRRKIFLEVNNVN